MTNKSFFALPSATHAGKGPYARQFSTDPSICMETLTEEVMEEIGKHKHDIITAVMPHWEDVTGYGAKESYDVLAIELEPLTPDFVRALAAALKVS